MCGRFTLTYRKAERLAGELGVSIEALTDYRPRYNIAPTDSHWVVRERYEEREVLPARWGLVNFWAKDRKQAFKNINARSETVQKAPTFRDAFAQRRCVVPADGFFEWTGEKNDRRPVWFHSPDDNLLLFAGLYESWRPSEDEKERTFTVLTTKANATVEPIHDRMPVILPHDAVEEWLFPRADPSSLLPLLQPAAEGVLVPKWVSPRVNSVKNDDPEVLEEEPELTPRLFA